MDRKTIPMDVQQWSIPSSIPPRGISPSLVVGIGEFGQAALRSLHLAAQVRPGLSFVLPVWVAPQGWQFDWPEKVSSEDYPEPEQWLQEHLEAGVHHLRQVVIRAWRAVQNGISIALSNMDILDVYILASLQEPFGRELLKPVLNVCRQAQSTSSDYVFTLILAFDTLTFPKFDPIEARKILVSLEVIAEELIASSDENELPGRVAWCYLLDSTDTHGHPLKPLKDQMRLRISIQELQADMAAEWISLLIAGLRHNPAYKRTSIVNIRRAFRDRPPTAWASSVGVGSFILPVRAIAESARDDLVGRILTNIILGHDQPNDLPSARRLRSLWLAECMLSPSDLRSRIKRDLGGQPFEFAIEPPSLEGIPDEAIINHLINWDILLWQRWNRSNSPKQRMAYNAKAIVEEARSWLERELDELVQKAPGGVRIALLFIGEAERALEDERQKPDVRHTKEKEHWLKTLLAPLLSRSVDPAALPDLEASRRRLEKVLSHRLNRRAVWVRASLFAAALTFFFWEANSLCGLAIERALLEGGTWGIKLIHWLQRIPSPTIGLLLLTMLCWLITSSACGVFLYRRETAIHHAIDHMIGDIRRKYLALMERTLRTEREQIYATLQAHLTEWAKVIEARRSILNEAAICLINEKKSSTEPASLQTEKMLLSASDWPILFPELDQEILRAYGEKFLNVPNRMSWREETVEQFMQSLRAFAEGELAKWFSNLNLETWTTRPGSSYTIPTLLEELIGFVRPAWPLSREERSELVAQLQCSGPITWSNPRVSPLLAVNFIGLPSKGNGEKASVPLAYPREETFSTGDPGRLAYIATLHALDLKRLLALDLLKAIAQEGSEAQLLSEAPQEEAKRI